MQLQKSCHLKCFLLLWAILGHRKYPNTNENVNTHFLISIDASLIITGGTLSIQDGSSIYNLICGAFFEFSWNFRKGHRFFIGVFKNYQINLSRTFWSNCSRMSGFFVFQKGGRKMAQSLKRASIAAPCCKKRITPERRRYDTPPKETERKNMQQIRTLYRMPFSGFWLYLLGQRRGLSAVTIYVRFRDNYDHSGCHN